MRTVWALHRYDPVAYFTDGKAVREIRSITAITTARLTTSSRPTTRWFSTTNLKNMLPNTAAIVRWRWGKLEDVDPNYFLVYEGKLFLQRNEKATRCSPRTPKEIVRRRTRTGPSCGRNKVV